MIGSNLQSINAIIDTTSPFLWVREKILPEIKNSFAPSDSITYVNSKEEFKMKNIFGTIKGTLGKDNIILNNKNITMIFGLIRELSLTDQNFDCVIGFGRIYDGIEYESKTLNESLSFLHQMKNVKNMRNIIFSIEFSKAQDNNYKPTLYLGAQHDVFEQFRDLTGFCNLRESKEIYPYWGCRMSHIMFGENTGALFKQNSKEVYIEALFDTSTYEIRAPIYLLNVFLDKLNKEKDNCVSSELGLFHKISCKKIEAIPEISFVFNGYALSLSKSILYAHTDNVYILKILFDKTTTYFHMGLIFFLDYHTLFNGEQKIMMFYNSVHEKIGNIRAYTEDRDFFFNEHALDVSLITIGTVFSLVLGAWILYRRNKKIKEKKALEEASLAKLI